MANVVVLARASEADAILRAAEMNALSLIYVRAILSPLASDVNKFVRDIRISGGIADLERVVNQLRGRGLTVDRVLVAPSVLRDVPAADLLQITRRIGVPLWRTLDSDLVSDAASMAPLDERTILSRPARRIDYEALSNFITGQKAMVVGGGGSIGSELARRLATFAPAEIIIVEHAEPALDAILEELQASHFGIKTEGVLADIRDRDRIFEVMAVHRPSLVIHAAALKHVNHLEVNWTEGIKTNVFGSVNVFEAAVAAGVPRVVFISTDKAVKPVSILGATKRFGELYARALDSEQTGTRFISVRFGNVLNSSGSAVPKFRAQIARRQPVTVTHPDMERYFISNREAGELVLTAALCSSRNDVPEITDASLFVLDMGSPVRILDLAEALIRLEGLEPGVDIPVKFTGLRPGERLFEIVNEDTEAARETPYDGVLALVDSAPHPAILRRLLDGLNDAIKTHNKEQAQSILQRGVPGYVPLRSQGS
ncbi:SDR family NAD(P)-dependent oxidoreductase [Rhizobiales bacterium TNE-4]|nr:SDR family NAD(P)-dependent oxidoreductase [Rhizobiales bacterium TNE-4]MBV1827571.1 SDR family NAD(P)-dependent oxidoreductase [Rhizobiales bacterium TNE-4]